MRNHWLTVIRYVAALMVVIHHMIFLRELGPGHFAYEVNRSGFSGVTLFFILSGIVLSMSYHDRIRGGGSILSFYWARLTRIVPLWFIVSLPLFLRTGSSGERFRLLRNPGKLFSSKRDWGDDTPAEAAAVRSAKPATELVA